MEGWLGRYTELIYAALRVMSGILFAFHGSQKLLAFPSGPKAEDPLMMVGGLIELLGGLLIALGLFASPAAFVASGEMAVAYFKSHAPRGFYPIENRGELAIVYCFLFLYIAARGSGRFSADAARRRKR